MCFALGAFVQCMREVVTSDSSQCSVSQSVSQSVPEWLFREVEGKLDGCYELPPGDLALYSRALCRLPVDLVPQCPEDASLHLVKLPNDVFAAGFLYADGSRLDDEPELAGLCVR